MSSYPVFKKLLQENYFEQVNQTKMNVGLKLLQYMVFKVVYLKIKDPKYFNFSFQKIPKMIISQLKCSSQQHLRMCLGEISQNSDYGILNNIENQIQKITKLKESSFYTQQSLVAPSSHMLTKTSFSEFKIEIEDKKSKPQRFLNSLEISSIKSNVRDTLSLSEMSGQIFSFNQPLIDVQDYLSNIQYKISELSYVRQHFSFPQIKWEQTSQGKDFICKGDLTIGDLYTREGDVLIMGSGKAGKKQKAKEEAALQILRQLYENYPNIFNQFLKIKKKKNL